LIDPHVRRAEHRDAEVLGHLETLARAGLADVRGGARWLDAHPRIASGWARAIDERAVFVGTLPGPAAADGSESEVIVALLVADLVNDPMPVARIDQVFVEDDARESGFGDALVAAAMEWGREVGARLIEAETLPGDRNLKNLYERAGVTARLITVSKRL
jgi:GNAT superfamily N-acetyltransferase